MRGVCLDALGPYVAACFLVTHTQTFLLAADTADACDAWVTAINAVVRRALRVSMCRLGNVEVCVHACGALR